MAQIEMLKELEALLETTPADEVIQAGSQELLLEGFDEFDLIVRLGL